MTAPAVIVHAAPDFIKVRNVCEERRGFARFVSGVEFLVFGVGAGKIFTRGLAFKAIKKLSATDSMRTLEDH